MPTTKNTNTLLSVVDAVLILREYDEQGYHKHQDGGGCNYKESDSCYRHACKMIQQLSFFGLPSANDDDDNDAPNNQDVSSNGICSRLQAKDDQIISILDMIISTEVSSLAKKVALLTISNILPWTNPCLYPFCIAGLTAAFWTLSSTTQAVALGVMSDIACQVSALGLPQEETERQFYVKASMFCSEVAVGKTLRLVAGETKICAAEAHQSLCRITADSQVADQQFTSLCRMLLHNSADMRRIAIGTADILLEHMQSERAKAVFYFVSILRLKDSDLVVKCRALLLYQRVSENSALFENLSSTFSKSDISIVINNSPASLPITITKGRFQLSQSVS